LGPNARYDPLGLLLVQPGDVALTITAVDALNAATITNVNPGTLVTQVPKGPGATELKNIANGYNDTYAAYYLSAKDNQVGFTFTPAAGQPVTNPIFVVQGYTTRQVPAVKVGGASVGVNTGAATSGAFASIKTDANELWVTLNQTLSAATQVQITPGGGCGSGLCGVCGAGATSAMPLTLLSLMGYRMRRKMLLARRRRR